VDALTDDEALESLSECCAAEGSISPAIETAGHALTGARKWAAQHPGATLVICLSGRGDKDMPTLRRTLLKGKL
jgi:tryptophan synthase beta chain